MRNANNVPIMQDPNPEGRKGFPLFVSTVDDGVQDYARASFDLIHWHDDIQFVYVERGTIVIDTLEQHYELKKGQGLFINSRAPHRIHERSMKGAYSYFLVPPSLLGFTSGSAMYAERVEPYIAPGCEQAILLSGDEPWHAQVLRLAHDAKRFIAAAHAGDGSLYRAAVCVVELWEAFTDHIPTTQRIGGERKADRMRSFLSFIQEHFSENITIEDIAAAGNVSKVECGRCFREAFDTSTYRYLTDYRMERACALLNEGALNVTEIASACGFSTPSHFANAFKKAMGMSPHAYRSSQDQ